MIVLPGKPLKMKPRSPRLRLLSASVAALVLLLSVSACSAAPAAPDPTAAEVTPALSSETAAAPPAAAEPTAPLPPATPAGEALPPAPTAEPTGAPDCAVGLPPTPADMEGPYFLDGSPERASLLEPGMPGERLVLRGQVFRADCKPIPGVRIEFWQADSAGVYDLTGYRLRGHLFTDADGRYSLETILPGYYEPRPRHIHVRLVPPEGPALTTQLYFPGDGAPSALTVSLEQDSGAQRGEFNFVLP